MNYYPAVLFLHLLIVGIAFGAAALIHWSQGRLRSAGGIASAREALLLCAAASRVMPLVGLALFVTGAALTHARWSWTTPWIDLSIGGLVVMLGIGGAVLRPRMARVERALGTAREGEVTADLAAAIGDRFLWVASHLPPALAIGIMYVMVTKPGAVGGVVALLVAAAAGAIAGTWTSRPEESAPAAAAQRAASPPLGA